MKKKSLLLAALVLLQKAAFGARQRIIVDNDSLEDISVCVEMISCTPFFKNTIEAPAHPHAMSAKNFFGAQILELSDKVPIAITISSSLEPHKTFQLMLDKNRKNINLMIGSLVLESIPYNPDNKTLEITIDRDFAAHFKSNYVAKKEDDTINHEQKTEPKPAASSPENIK